MAWRAWSYFVKEEYTGEGSGVELIISYWLNTQRLVANNHISVEWSNQSKYMIVHHLQLKWFLTIAPEPLFTKRTESYRNISWSLEAARFRFRLFQSFWNLTGTWKAALSRCLSNFLAIRSSWHQSRLQDFTRLALRRLTAGFRVLTIQGLEPDKYGIQSGSPILTPKLDMSVW